MAKKRDSKALKFVNPVLADALSTGDIAAIAFALRNGPTVVPLMKPGNRDNPNDYGEIWTYRDPESGELALLLFSDAKNKPKTLPPAVGLHGPEWLQDFLKTHGSAIKTVFFDIAGPHPVQASPEDLLAAFELPAPDAAP